MRTAALLLLLCACTTARELTAPLGARELHDLNEEMRDREVQLGYLREGESVYTQIDVEQLRLDAERAHFLQDGAPRQVPAAALHSLTYLSPGSPRWRGAMQGFLAGLGIAELGGATGGLIAATCSKASRCSGEALVPVVIGGFLGLVAAPAIGALIGHHEEVTITAPQ